MLHPSRIFAIYLLLFLFCCALFTLLPTHAGPPLYYLLVALGLAILFWRQKLMRYSALTVLIILLAMTQVVRTTPRYQPDWWTFYVGQEISQPLVVASEPKVAGKTQTFLVTAPSGRIKGKLELTTGQFPIREYGEVIEVEGKINSVPQPTGFQKSQQIVGTLSFPKIRPAGDYYMPLASRYYYRLRATLIGIKGDYVSQIGRILPEPEAGLLSGIIFGTKAELSTYLTSILIITGTIHIIALSGYNITIVAGMCKSLFGNWSRNLAFFVPLFGIFAFVLATGLSASIVRAMIMGLCLMTATRLGRQSDSLNAILLASVMMACANPYILLFDVGFQLSFAAVSGIIFFQPQIERYFRVLGPQIGPIMAGTIAAQLFSWPIIAYYFGRISLISILANALILPLIPALMSWGFLVASLSFVLLPFARVLGLLVWALLAYILRVTEYLSGLPLASVSYQGVGPWFLVGYYLLLLEITYFFNLRSRKNASKSQL